MSDNIDKMNFKQLRNEVQLLRDEIAIMKRKYEDAIYNIDESNFSSKIIQERDNMKAEISVTADEIKTKLSKEDLDGDIMLKDYISKRIAQLRIKKNVSARAMSQTLGQNPSYINRIENGQAMPSFEVLPYIFDCTDYI